MTLLTDCRGDIWHVDEVYVKIQGQQFYLWRAVDQDGDVLDILVTKRRNKKAAAGVRTWKIGSPLPRTSCKSSGFPPEDSTAGIRFGC